MACSLSPLVQFGASAWTYEDWQGRVYTRQYAKITFARECLEEYCQYQYQGEPLSRTVGNDLDVLPISHRKPTPALSLGIEA